MLDKKIKTVSPHENSPDTFIDNIIYDVKNNKSDVSKEVLLYVITIGKLGGAIEVLGFTALVVFLLWIFGLNHLMAAAYPACLIIYSLVVLFITGIMNRDLKNKSL